MGMVRLLLNGKETFKFVLRFPGDIIYRRAGAPPPRSGSFLSGKIMRGKGLILHKILTTKVNSKILSILHKAGYAISPASLNSYPDTPPLEYTYSTSALGINAHCYSPSVVFPRIFYSFCLKYQSFPVLTPSLSTQFIL